MLIRNAAAPDASIEAERSETTPKICLFWAKAEVAAPLNNSAAIKSHLRKQLTGLTLTLEQGVTCRTVRMHGRARRSPFRRSNRHPHSVHHAWIDRQKLADSHRNAGAVLTTVVRAAPEGSDFPTRTAPFVALHSARLPDNLQVRASMTERVA